MYESYIYRGNINLEVQNQYNMYKKNEKLYIVESKTKIAPKWNDPIT